MKNIKQLKKSFFDSWENIKLVKKSFLLYQVGLTDVIDFNRQHCLNFEDILQMRNNKRDKMIPEEQKIHNLNQKLKFVWKIIKQLFSVCTIIVEKNQVVNKIVFKKEKLSCYNNCFLKIG